MPPIRVDDTIMETKEVPKEITFDKFVKNILNVQITGWDYDDNFNVMPYPVRINKRSGALLVELTGAGSINIEQLNLNTDELEGKVLTQALPKLELSGAVEPGLTRDFTVSQLVGAGHRCYGLTIMNTGTETIGVNFDADATAGNNIPVASGDVVAISSEIVTKLSIYFPEGYADLTKLIIIPEREGRRITA